jgi:hypothetical protein
LPEAVERVHAIENEGLIGCDETGCHVRVTAESSVAA